MKKHLSIFLIAPIFFALSALGQSSDQSSATQNSASSVQNSSSAAANQSANDQSAASSGSASAGESMEGCVVKQETDYFIQPVNGNRLHLNAQSTDLSSYVGQDVRVHGKHWNPNNQNNENNSQASSQPSGAPVSGAVATGKGQDFLVDRVDVISTNCPPSGSSGSPR